MDKRVGWGGVVLVGGVALSCSSDDGRDERIGAASSAIGSNSPRLAPVGRDVLDDPFASVVVDIRGSVFGSTISGTGTLITPLVVLTAGHVIDGKTVDGVTDPGLGQNAPVYVLRPRAELQDVAAHRAVRAVTRLGAPVTVGREGDDLALVFLDRDKLRNEVEQARSTIDGTVDQSGLEWSTLLETHARRPSFQTPPASISGNRYTFTDRLSIAGFTDGQGVRFVGTSPAGASFARDAGRWITNASLASDGFWLVFSDGDSGGPLYRVSPDGRRDPFGVMSATHKSNVGDFTDFFADITRLEIVQWIAANAKETGRSDRWLARHGRRDLWYGEVDYTGPCNQSRDADCDHWYTEHDNCSAIYNPDQNDTDDDGIGDACDACPTLPSAGVGNCNGSSELFHARGYQKLVPDVCDPVPCPSSTIDPATTRIDSCVENPPVNGVRSKNCESRSIRSFLTTKTLGSHDSQGRQTIAPDVETSARFCHSCTDDARCDPVIDCRNQDAIQDEQLFVPESSTAPWHRVTFGLSSRFELQPPRGATFRWDYGQTVSTNRWFFESDYADWLAEQPAPLIQVLDRDRCEGSTVPGTCLGGVFWLHADTPFGAAERGDELANHHFGWQPDVLKGYCLGPSAFVFSEARVGAAAMSSTTFAGGFSPGEVVLPASTLVAIDINPSPESQLMIPSPVGVVGALQWDGSVIALSDDGVNPCRGSVLTKRIADTVLSSSWLSGADRGTSSNAFADVLAVSLSADGRALLEGLVTEEGGLLLATETPRYHGSFGTTEGAVAPPSRVSFAATFSLSAGGVFLAGGRDATSGAALRDVWFRPLGGDWTELSTGVETMGTPLAATYGFADDRLWLLDEVDDVAAPPRERRRARLLRVDPSGGGASRAFYVPRKRPELNAFLATEQDGSVLLALADTSRFSLLRLRANANGIFIGRARTERGRLIRPPIIDENGYSFVVLDDTGLRVIRRRTLTSVACDDDAFTESDAPNGGQAASCDATKLERLF